MKSRKPSSTVSGQIYLHGEIATEGVRRKIGGMWWISVRSAGMKTAWRSEDGRYHICRTFGLMPWELYAGDIYDSRHFMRKLLNDSDNLHVLIEHSIRDKKISRDRLFSSKPD